MTQKRIKLMESSKNLSVSDLFKGLLSLLLFDALLISGCSKSETNYRNRQIDTVTVIGQELQGLAANYKIKINQVSFSKDDPNRKYDASMLQDDECFMTVDLTINNQSDQTIGADNHDNFRITRIEGANREEAGRPLRQSISEEIKPGETVDQQLFYVVDEKGALELQYIPFAENGALDRYVIRNNG